MPLFEYILLGLLGSGGAAVLDGAPPATGALTLGAEAIVQPNGGVVASAAQRPRKEANNAGSKDPVKPEATVKGGTRSHSRSGRHHRRTHHRRSHTFQK
jgi:hypothetical protein